MGNLNQEIISQEKLQTALEYIKLGWHVLPLWQMVGGKCACGNANCKSPGKHPISHLVPHGQNSAATDEQTVTNWWTRYPEANIGVYLAPSNLCAVDIDPRHGGDYTIEELEGIHGAIESDVLQLTGGGGEHRVFKLPEGVKLPGTLGKGIDLKSNGYIVVEPSNHVSGGVYEWEASSNPLDGIEPSELPRWICELAGASASSPVEAGGEPINFGMTSDQYEDVLAALPFIPADERETWLAVGMALHHSNDSRAYELWCQWSSSSDKYDHKDQFRVWRSFKHKGLSGYDLATVFYLAQENGWANKKKEILPIPDIAEIISEPEVSYNLDEIEERDRTPEVLLTTPVEKLNDFIEWAESRSRQPQREISVLTGLALASVLAGRNYVSEEGNTSSLYFLLLAPTGVGKNIVKESIHHFLVESQMADLIGGSGNTSPGAVFTSLCRAPCHIQITDEIGKQLAAARKASNGQMAEALATMTEAYSATTSYLVPKNYSQMGQISKGESISDQQLVVHYPAMTSVGLGTLKQIFDNLTTGEIEDGYLNRQISIIISEPQAKRRRAPRKPVPQELKEHAYKIRNPERKSSQDLTGAVTSFNATPTTKDVLFETAALELFDDMHDHLEQTEAEGGFVLPDLTRRWVENAMRLSVALAVFESPERPIITAEIAGWSAHYIAHYGDRFMKVASTNVADSDHHRLYLNIIEQLEKAGANGRTPRELSQRSRLFQSARPHDREQAFKALMQEGRVVSVKMKSMAGRERKAFIEARLFDEKKMELVSF